MIKCVNRKCIHNRDYSDDGCNHYWRTKSVLLCDLYEGWTDEDRTKVYDDIIDLITKNSIYLGAWAYRNNIKKPEESMDECINKNCEYYSSCNYHYKDYCYEKARYCSQEDYEDHKKPTPCMNRDCVNHDDSSSGCNEHVKNNLNCCPIYRRLYD